MSYCTSRHYAIGGCILAFLTPGTLHFNFGFLLKPSWMSCQQLLATPPTLAHSAAPSRLSFEILVENLFIPQLLYSLCLQNKHRMTDVKVMLLARAASQPFETTAIVAAKHFNG